MEEEATKTTEIAVVTVPAFSHQASILEFCKRLVLLHQDHHFHVTCLIPTVGSPSPASIALVRSLPPSITCIFLPPINLHDDDQHDVVDGLFLQDQLQLAVSRSMPVVRTALESPHLGSSSRVAALVAEPLSIEALDIAKEMEILGYLYFPCSAMMLSLCLYSSKLNEEVSCEFRDLEEGIQIPGCVRVSGKDLPDNLQDRSCLSYSQFLQRCLLYHRAQGILVNSFTEMEAGAIKAWQAEEGNVNSPSIYAIGPIIRTGSSTSDPIGSDPSSNNTCLGWLEKQPPKSILYVSFGSGGTLSQAQITELALGLELSKQRFLWVNVRPPSDKSSENYLNDENYYKDKNDPLQDFLPEGFLERTKERGLVIACWAPQVQVLSHSSIGGFLSHCGWNSILESIVYGVPLIAWPLFAEQRTNAAMVVEGLKVAMRPRVMDGSGGIVEKEEIGRVIKCVMEDGGGEEGEGIRRRMNELRDAAACALMEDGSSTKTLSNLAHKWRKLGGAKLN